MSQTLFKDVVIENSIDDSFMIKVEGQVFKTPKGEVVAGSSQLIEAVAQELKTQNAELNFNDMPLTRYVFTAFDRVRKNRDSIINEIVRYAETDLLCYRVASPQELVKKQNELWQPVLDWSKYKYDIELVTSIEIQSIFQDPKSLEKVFQIIKVCD